MEYRQLGNSGLKVSVLTMGTMTFGGKGNFAKVGNLQLDEVRKLIDIVADAGVNLIDTANVYSGGGSEGREGAWRGGGVNYDVDFIDCRLKRKDARAACNKCRRSWNRRHSSAALNHRGRQAARPGAALKPNSRARLRDVLPPLADARISPAQTT